MPGDFQTYFPKVYGFRPHMRHIRTSGMADSEFFQRHSDQLLDRSRGRFAQNAPAEKVLRGVLRESPAASVEELIRMALKKL